MFDGMAGSAALAAAREIAPVALGDILDRIARRLAWYGLPQSGISAVEIRDRDKIVATLTVAGNGVFREEFDGRTGMVRRRDAIECASSSRHGRVRPI
jgi:hypothetical protein